MSACPHCASGVPRIWGEHLLSSERGVANLGACAEPEDLVFGPAPDHFVERLAAWRERIRGMGKRVDEPVATLPHWMETAANREEETDGES